MSSTYTDLPAAMIGWLRSQPGLAAAFGDDGLTLATRKFWGDAAQPSVPLPWAVYSEEAGTTTYMTGDRGNVPYLDEATIQFVVVAASKQQARQLGDLIAAALTDPPLVFSDGTLMMMRPTNPFFAPVSGIAPDHPTAYARVVSLSTMVQRYT